VSKDTHVYIGTTKCGCNVAAVVDMVDKPEHTAGWVRDMIKEGYSVQRHTLADYHDRKVILSRCTHAEVSP
jgi:hypothetical protein